MLCWSCVGLWAPSDLGRDSEGHLTVPRSQLVCRLDVWESGVGLWETVQWACLSWWHLHTSHILGVSFSKSWGTRPWSGNCLSEPRRLYLRCSYFCFVYPVFILVTVSVSDLGVSVQISLWVYVIIFSEDVCYLHILMAGTLLLLLGKCESLERIVQCDTKENWYLPENYWFTLPRDR